MDVGESIEGVARREEIELGIGNSLPSPAGGRSALAFVGALLLHALLFLFFTGLSGVRLSPFSLTPAARAPRPSPPVRVVFYETQPGKPEEPPPAARDLSDRTSRARSEVAPAIPSPTRLPAAAGQSAARRPAVLEARATPLPTGGNEAERGKAREKEEAPPARQPEPVSLARSTSGRPDEGLSPARTLVSPSLATWGGASEEAEPPGGRFGSGALSSAIRREGLGNPASGVHETGSLEFDAKDFEWGSYARKIYAIVDRNWKSVIPLAARMPGVTGKVKVRFRIRKDGKVEGLELLLACGRTALDQAALASIQLSDPLPPLPPEFPRDDVGVTFGYYYNLPVEDE